MRADRLLSILMLLQSRGQLTAHQLAAELEVSERTIYRDITALSTSGVPVYGTSGPEGGYALVESYRTSLTGLTSGEARALFALSIPAPLDELGLALELKAALRKLSAALPDSRRSDELRVRQRIHLDSTGWHHQDESAPHLQILYQAVWQDRRVSLQYQPLPMVEMELTAEPYALVAKAGIWHLVYHHHAQFHVQRLSGFLDVRILPENFIRRPDFDLPGFWEQWCARQEGLRTIFPVRLRVEPGFIKWLPTFFGGRIHEQIAQAPPPDPQGRIILEISFESLETARQRLLGCGAGVEVLAPKALRASVQDYAAQIMGLYASPES
jgi:predicted DNA-binding transcriptional regulator YafY